MDSLVFDRTQADVTYAAELNRKLGRGEALTAQELADWNAGLKGAYNASDMNRVDAAVRELGGMLTAAGYPVRYTSPVPQPEKPLTNFTLKSDDFQQAPYLYATGEHDTQYADDYISTKVMIDVSASQKIYITTNVALLQDSGFVWYDKNRQFISGAKSEDISEYSMSATPPQNAQYCNININSTGVTPNSIQVVNVIYNDADDYIELTYIESSGTQYIDTGYKPNSNTRVVCKVSNYPRTNTNQTLFGSRTGVGSADAFCFLTTSQYYYRTDYSSKTWSYDSSINITADLIIDKNKNVTMLNGANTSTLSTASFSSSHNLYIAAMNNGGAPAFHTSGVKFHSCQIYDDNILIRDYKPAMQNGDIGLYDRIEGKMFSSLGADEFIAGEAIIKPEPEPEPEKTEFEIGDIIKYDIWRTYLANVQSIRDAYYTMPDTPELPEPTAPLTYDGANAIEKLLYDISQLYDAMVTSYRLCGAFRCGNNAQHLPLQRSVI